MLDYDQNIQCFWRQLKRECFG